jgi:hypothetical protein
VDAYSAEHWSDFAVAHVGAGGVLVGLVFVALSINLREIVASTVLVNRGIECILLFFTALVSSSFVLLPGQARGALAAEMIVLAVAVASSLFVLSRAGSGEVKQVDRAVRLMLAFASPLLLAVGGISVAAEAGGGLFWWTGSLLFAYLAGLSGAWVLLVEILR